MATPPPQLPDSEAPLAPSPVKPTPLPQSVVANLQNVLAARRPVPSPDDAGEASVATEPAAEKEGEVEDEGPPKPAVLVTCAGGIRSPGLASFVEALSASGLCRVYVCAPDSDKSNFGHAISLHETVGVTSVEMLGAKAFETTGTAVDCVSLVLSSGLPSWPRPDLVISGINTGTNCGHEILHSAAVAAAQEAFMSGVPSLVISLCWKKDESKESDFKDATDTCMPVVRAAIGDVEKKIFPPNFFLNIGIPSSPSTNKGFKVTRLSPCIPAQNWEAVSTSRPGGAANVMSKHYGLGIQLAQLGRDASAAGAARRIGAQKKAVEVESVAPAGKPESREQVKKSFRAEVRHPKQEGLDDDHDIRALESSFISVTPLSMQLGSDPEIQASASEWLSAALTKEQEAS